MPFILNVQKRVEKKRKVWRQFTDYSEFPPSPPGQRQRQRRGAQGGRGEGAGNMVVSTFDRLREQLALPMPAKPVEPRYPAPTKPSPRPFLPPTSGTDGYGEQGASRREVMDSDDDRPHSLLGSSLFPDPPDLPAPVLHWHASRTSMGGRYLRPTVPQGLDHYSEHGARSFGAGARSAAPDTSQSASAVGYEGPQRDWQDYRNTQDTSMNDWRGPAFDMEQQLEMVAWSLRDQDEAHTRGVRRGLMMLQPFSKEFGGDGERVHTSQSVPDASPMWNQSDSLRSLSDTQRLPVCPTDYLRQVAAIERVVLRPEDMSSTWVSGEGITALCITPWSARASGQLSLQPNDVLDMSFFDSASLSQEWWFAVKAHKQHVDREQSDSRVWRFPQDLGVLRKQSGYFPSKCVRLVAAPQKQSSMPEQQPFVQNGRPETFPILQPDPLNDPPLIPFANVPLWLPTWSPRGEVPSRESGESFPAITSASEHSQETFAMTAGTTPSASYLNLQEQGAIATADCSSRNLSSEFPDCRTVQILRNPDALPGTAAGIGLQFARPRGQMGACHVLALKDDMPACKSGLVKIGDLIHAVQGIDIYNHTPEDITQLILGPPSTFVSLTVSSRKGKDGFATAFSQEQVSGHIQEEKADDVGVRELAARSTFQEVYQRIRAGDAQAVELDLKRGDLKADIVLESNSKWRPLHYASADGHRELVDLLITYGADLSAQTIHGATAPDIARANGHHELADHMSRSAASVQVAWTEQDRAAAPKLNMLCMPTWGKSPWTKRPATSSSPSARSALAPSHHLTLPDAGSQQSGPFPLIFPPVSSDSPSERYTVTIHRAPPTNGGTPTLSSPTGLGIQFARRPGDDGEQSMTSPYVVMGLIPDSPASRCGLISAGDEIIQIDGVDITPLTVTQIANMIIGLPSTAVTLTLSRLASAMGSVPTISVNHQPLASDAGVQSLEDTFEPGRDSAPSEEILSSYIRAVDQVASPDIDNLTVDSVPPVKEGSLERNVADPCVSDLQTQPEHRMSPAPKLSPQLQPFPMEQALSQLQPNFQPSISPPVIQMADYSFRAFSQSPQTHGATQPVGQFCAGNDGNGHVQVYRDSGQAMQEVTEGQGLLPETVADAANRDEWERAEDPRTGRVYNVNHKTKNTTWDAPHASPRAWVDPRKHAASLPWSASAASHQPLGVPKAPAPVRKRFSMFGFSSGQ